MSTALITTTIHVPELLNDYCANANKYGHEDLILIIVGDKKTPRDAKEFCQKLNKKWGYEVEYYTVANQENFLKDYPKLGKYLPYNSLSRRNIALLRAYVLQAQTIITIDDDNFVQKDDDYIKRQNIVGTERKLEIISSQNGWYNVCELLVEEHDLPFYPRGWPLPKRWQKTKITTKSKKGKVVVNAGLWLEAPDIDALTWLDLPIKTTAYRSDYPNGIALNQGTWAPFNSQNTALAWEVIPAYFLSPYIGRYDDIWASYIVKKIADYLGHYIHFGPPIVTQKRNPHNYFKDFDLERLGLETTDQFVKALQTLNLKGTDYNDCFGEILDWLDKNHVTIWNTLSKENKQNIKRMLQGMRLWHEAINAVSF